MVTGALVAVFDFLLRDQAIYLLYQIQNAWLYVVLPVLGLVAATLVTRYAVPSREGALTEDYILVFHDQRRYMRWTNLPGKMVSSFITIACGGSLGLEGPSIYLGATVGDSLQNRFRAVFRNEDTRLLMVAGAAAGISAIFKAPLTGVLFAMEAPYKNSLAGRALIPALVSSASSYVTFVLLVGNEPLFAQEGHGAFKVRDILLAMVLGAMCGLLAKWFVWLVKRAQHLFGLMQLWLRPVLAGLVVGTLGVLVFRAAGEPYLYGPGYRLVRHVLETGGPLSLFCFFWVAKAVASAASLAGGGVGGVFFPMAVLGALTGSAFGQAIGEPHGTLYPLVGLAAFVGAGYRTPVAAVAFVAETTGNPWVLIPAMVATVVGFLVMGSSGISDEQHWVSVTHPG
jgi:CIC family chloride channel protein